MASEHLPIETGDARFFLAPWQIERLGSVLVELRAHRPAHWRPGVDTWRPTATLLADGLGPDQKGWHRTSFLQDMVTEPDGTAPRPARVTISVWQHAIPAYSRQPHGVDSGIDVTVQAGEAMQTAYLSDAGRAWLEHRKLQAAEGGSAWVQDLPPGNAAEATAFIGNALTRYLDFRPALTEPA